MGKPQFYPAVFDIDTCLYELPDLRRGLPLEAIKMDKESN
jgi:hypothetical protein